MPSLRHEFVINLFRQNPQFLLSLVHDALGIVPPPHTQVQVGEADVTELIPVEARADLVLLFLQEGRVVYALVVEIQLERDSDKWYTWPVYWAVERARRRCPVGLLVVALTEETAQWAARALTDGNPGGGAVKPLVLGPAGVPPVTDEARAEEAPELAMMSLLAHADEPVVAEVARAALAAIKTKPEEQAKLYYKVIVAVLEHACRKGLLERLVMQTFIEKYGDRLDAEVREIYRNLYRDLDEAKGEAKGKAAGKAESVLMLLRKRGVAADEAAAARILSCRDVEVLDCWFDRAITAVSVQDLFSE